MAEIHVQTKKRATPLWIWLVLIILILGALAYLMILRSNKADQRNTNQTNPSSFIQSKHSNELIWV